jgi:hypothetical protein
MKIRVLQLTGAQVAATRQHNGGEKRWQLNLDARAKWSARERGREGEIVRCSLGVCSPFYRGREVATGGNG